MPEESQITMLLRSAAEGDAAAAEELLPLVYEELRAVAHARMGRIPPGQTLQPTALVHEAYLRAVGNNGETYENRAHFFFVAARAMRDILVNQAAHKATLKKGGDRKRVSTANLAVPIEAPAEDMLALDEGLKRLETDHERAHQVVMLRFFAGLTAQQAADILDVSLRTVESDWRFAKATLRTTLKSGDSING
ncbi:MAG: ECF-type sigma factor [Planctomycetota bacterium]